MVSALISIIIPTSVGREKEVKALITSLLKMKNEFHEIIVVVDKSKELRNYLINVKKKHKIIRVLFSSRIRGRCKAKNLGAKKARGDILLFLDDDVKEVSKNYFKVIRETFTNPIVGAVSGREIKPKKKSIIKKIVSNKVGIITSLGEVISNFDANIEKPKIVYALPGCNLAIKKDVFKLVGGFDENYDVGTAYREETDLQLRIKKAGYLLIFNPKISVIHEEKESPTRLKKWFRWYYVLNTYFFLKNFNPSPLKFLFFIYKEFLGCCMRMLIYKKPYPIVYFPRIIEGIVYYMKNKKTTSRN